MRKAGQPVLFRGRVSASSQPKGDLFILRARSMLTLPLSHSAHLRCEEFQATALEFALCICIYPPSSSPPPPPTHPSKQMQVSGYPWHQAHHRACCSRPPS
jgi:hypothetical protein